MKFFICALVLFALSMNAQAGVVPFALNAPILYSAAYGPGLSIAHSNSIVGYAPGFPALTHQLYNYSPLIVPSVGLNAEATYVARTPGSEHIASLPGHSISTSSINLEQAPGDSKDIIKDSSSLLPSVAIHGSAVPAALPLVYSQFTVPAPIVLPAEATYVAKNLGVEHYAPLPGHIVSTTSLNLEPAPGSK